MSIKIQLIVHAVPAALAAGEVNVQQTEPRMEGGNEAAFDVEERGLHPEAKLEAGISQKSRHPAVAETVGGIPNDLIAGESTLLLLELLGPDFDLLQAQNVGLLFPDPL
jgi:hypothetical protein